MTGAALLAMVLASTDVAPDACAGVPPAEVADPAAAAEYRAIGLAERDRGDRDTAVVALRRAAALDPSDTSVRAALAALCSANVPPDPFQDGLRRMDAGDLRGAADAFRRTRDAGPSAPAALLEGICRYELGEDAAASQALREAEQHPPLRADARLYLGLIALRSGASREAVGLFDDAARNPALAPTAEALAAAARSSAPLVLVASVDGGWDSNVTLEPTGQPGLAPEASALAGFAASALYRPLGLPGPFVRLSGFDHEPLSLRDFAYSGLDAAAGWEHRAKRWGGAAGYGYGGRWFGGAPYMTAHRLELSGWRGLGPATLGAIYGVRLQRHASEWSDLDGVEQRGELRVAVPLHARASLIAGYGLGGLAAETQALAWVEHGPLSELRIVAGRRLRTGLSVALSWRRYGAVDPALGLQRTDVQVDGTAWLERDVSPSLKLRAALGLHRVDSNAPALSYTQVVPTIGFVFTRGL